MAFWIKLTYERSIYVVDLDRVGAFCQISNGRVSFTLPGSNETMIIHHQSDPASYQAILDYVEKVSGFSLMDEG